MRILAIETSSKTVSVALLEQTRVIMELDSRQESNADPTANLRLAAGNDDQLPPGFVRKRSKGKSRSSRVFPPGASVLLAPMLQMLFERTSTPISQIELVAVTIGPGSFTGLRVGVVTAKSLAYSTGAQIIGVNSLETIANQTAASLDQSKLVEGQRICSVVNAQRQQVFAGCYEVDELKSGMPPVVKALGPDQIFDHQAWFDQLQPGDVLTGPALGAMIHVHEDRFSQHLVAQESSWNCMAGSVGKLAWRQYSSGQRQDLWKLEPLYFRPSAAEEVRNASIG